MPTATASVSKSARATSLSSARGAPPRWNARWAWLLATALCLPAALWAQAIRPSLLLVASERLADPRFQHTVVLVTRHGGPGVIGVILNRPLAISLGKVFPSLPPGGAAGQPLFFGGPVATGQLVFAFGDRPAASSDRIEVHPGVYLGQAPGLLAQLLHRTPPPERLRVFAGHAGWAAGQLEGEIARGDWLLLPFDPALLFAPDTSRLWPELYRKASEKRAAAAPPLRVSALLR